MNYHPPAKGPGLGIPGETERSAAGSRVVLLNVKYSPNLGDGIIAECLEKELSCVCPDWQVQSIDLAGRVDYGTGLDASREKVLRVLEALPQPLRKIATAFALSLLIAARYRRRWRRQLGGTDAAIVGGGQLFADSNLNFPLKLRAILTETGRAGIPAAVFGVGVARELSSHARKLFLRGMRKVELSHVAVRDTASRYNWERHFGRTGQRHATLCRDPGLLASEVYPRSDRGHRERPLVGIGIVNPRTLDLHSDEDENFSINTARDFWAALAKALLAKGNDVALFTNGPHDDEKFLETVMAQVGDPRLWRVARPQAPADLAATIAGFDAVAAHRLHACILAYSYRVPHVGLAWDPKVEAFFNSVGRRDYVANHTEAEVGDIAELVEQALASGIDGELHSRALAETREAIAECARSLELALTGS